MLDPLAHSHAPRKGDVEPEAAIADYRRAGCRAGVVAGSQGIGGCDLAVLREVRTDSWLGRA